MKAKKGTRYIRTDIVHFTSDWKKVLEKNSIFTSNITKILAFIHKRYIRTDISYSTSNLKKKVELYTISLVY